MDFVDGADLLDLSAWNFGSFAAFQTAVDLAAVDGGIELSFGGGAVLTVFGIGTIGADDIIL